MAVVYHYPGCSTCKKALAWLSANKVEVERIDLVATPPDVTTLSRLWQQSGKPIEKLFNVSGQSYRDGGFKDRLPALSAKEKLAALAADGKLIKRPILDLGLEVGNRVLVGFDERAWTEVLAEAADALQLASTSKR